MALIDMIGTSVICLKRYTQQSQGHVQSAFVTGLKINLLSKEDGDALVK
jgi:hypothetical protein